MRVLPIALLSMCALTACGPTSQTYQVSVINQSATPMTVVLTKDGPPMEQEWLPPEDIAMMRNVPDNVTVNGIVVQPKTKVAQERTGKFENGTHAMLRVYHGEQSMKQMLGISPDSPNRRDLVLHPGQNTIVIDPSGNAEAR